MWSISPVAGNFAESPQTLDSMSPCGSKSKESDGQAALLSSSSDEPARRSARFSHLSGQERALAKAIHSALNLMTVTNEEKEAVANTPVWEPAVPLPQPGMDASLSKQYLGDLFLLGLMPERVYSSDVMDSCLKEHYPYFVHEMNQAHHDDRARQRMQLAQTIGDLLWPEYIKGRTGKISQAGELFWPVPVFSGSTRQKLAAALDAAWKKKIITTKEWDRVTSQLGMCIPSQNVVALLSAGRMKISCYRCLASEAGQLVVRHHIEARPVDPADTTLKPCKIYEGSSDHYASIAADLERHIADRGWLRDADLAPLPTEVQQLVDDPHATLKQLSLPPYEEGVTQVTEHVQNIAYWINHIHQIIAAPWHAEQERQTMRENIFVLRGLLTRFLRTSLPAMSASVFSDMMFKELLTCFEAFRHQICADTFVHVHAAIISAVAGLPEAQRRVYLPLLHEVQKDALRCHQLKLMMGGTTPFLKNFDDTAAVLASTPMHNMPMH